jgi:hypothetical protein
MRPRVNRIFIDKEINVIQGQDADLRIQEKNDSKYIENDSILKVDRERWLDAQYYERKTWMQLGLSLSDDRNYEHSERFDNYSKLKENNKSIKKVIELGCGPFTNLRTIYSLLPNIEEVHLLDPLLNDYLNHPNCFYKNKNFSGYKTVTHSCPIEDFNNDDIKDGVVNPSLCSNLTDCYSKNKLINDNTNLSTKGRNIFLDKFNDYYKIGIFFDYDMEISQYLNYYRMYYHNKPLINKMIYNKLNKDFVKPNKNDFNKYFVINKIFPNFKSKIKYLF